jgi:hypothetical protein
MRNAGFEAGLRLLCDYAPRPELLAGPLALDIPQVFFP